jgi:cytochrome c oxidase subunit 3
MKRREPLQFMLWLAVGASGLIFLFLIGAYLARKNNIEGWNNTYLPEVFSYSTVAIVLSSLTLWQANVAFKREHFLNYRLMMGLTLALGVLFICLQFLGWHKLTINGSTMSSSVSAAFVYVISGVHLAHILGGILLLIIVFVEALRNFKYVDSFVYSVNPPNQLKLTLVSIYWHFVDVLWVILFLFLLYHQPK